MSVKYSSYDVVVIPVETPKEITIERFIEEEYLGPVGLISRNAGGAVLDPISNQQIFSRVY